MILVLQNVTLYIGYLTRPDVSEEHSSFVFQGVVGARRIVGVRINAG
jgi:hypothetical protein